jgi:hypothetical protein
MLFIQPYTYIENKMKNKFHSIFIIAIISIFSISSFAADTWVPSESVVNCGIDMRNAVNSPQPNYSYLWINGSSGTIYRYFFDKNIGVQLSQAQMLLSLALTAKTTRTTIGINHETGYINQIQLN